MAARIQQAAAPGSVWVSSILFDHVRRNSPFIFDDLGERRFKNLSEPVRVYQVRGDIGAHRLQSVPTSSGFSTGSTSVMLTTTASLSERTSTHSSV